MNDFEAKVPENVPTFRPIEFTVELPESEKRRQLCVLNAFKMQQDGVFTKEAQAAFDQCFVTTN